MEAGREGCQIGPRNLDHEDFKTCIKARAAGQTVIVRMAEFIEGEAEHSGDDTSEGYDSSPSTAGGLRGSYHRSRFIIVSDDDESGRYSTDLGRDEPGVQHSQGDGSSGRAATPTVRRHVLYEDSATRTVQHEATELQRSEQRSTRGAQGVSRSCRDYVVTSFAGAGVDWTAAFTAAGDWIRYAIWQRERAPSSGREHWQMYIELSRKTTFRALVARVPDLAGAHFEPRAGTADEARDYCRKEDTRLPGTAPMEFGEFQQRQPGRRSDLLAAAQLVQSGAADRVVAETYPGTFIRYHRGLSAFRSVVCRVADLEAAPTVTVFFGRPGTGKTTLARSRMTGEIYCKSHDTKWWDLYQGEKNVLLDEFIGQIDNQNMNKLADKFAWIAEIKGGSMLIRPACISITTNRWPDNWWTGSTTTYWESWTRRVTSWVWCTRVGAAFVNRSFATWDEFSAAVPHSER